GSTGRRGHGVDIAHDRHTCHHVSVRAEDADTRYLVGSDPFDAEEPHLAPIAAREVDDGEVHQRFRTVPARYGAHRPQRACVPDRVTARARIAESIEGSPLADGKER